MLKVTGIAFNVIGLAITLFGIAREARARNAPVLTARETALVNLIRTKLGIPTSRTVHPVTATATIEIAGDAVVQKVRRQDAPLEDQLRTIEANVDAKVDNLRRSIARAETAATRRIDAVSARQTELSARMHQVEQDDREITGNSLRLETFGVVLALFGTSLSAFD